MARKVGSICSWSKEVPTDGIEYPESSGGEESILLEGDFFVVVLVQGAGCGVVGFGYYWKFKLY